MKVALAAVQLVLAGCVVAKAIIPKLLNRTNVTNLMGQERAGRIKEIDRMRQQLEGFQEQATQTSDRMTQQLERLLQEQSNQAKEIDRLRQQFLVLSAQAEMTIGEALELMFGLGSQQMNRPAVLRILQEVDNNKTKRNRALAIGLMAEVRLLNGSWDEAKESYSRALGAGLESEAKQGDAIAQWLFGRVHGIGVVKGDKTAAVEWYRRAADQGLSMAQNSLGSVYRFGLGVEQDYASALKWYRKAADQNHADAQFNLGVMYETGQGVDKDLVRARELYEKAAAQGNDAAKTRLSNIGNK